MPRLGILLSGAGSTYANLAGELGGEVAVVVASRADAGGARLARENGHALAIAHESAQVTAALRAHGVEWVAMCGWMRYWDPPDEFRERALNIHPSLLPAFGGKGMYGIRVHEAVLAAGCKLSGCTAHLVGGDYDSGPILAQRAVTVREDDTPETLQSRVQEVERALYPQVVRGALEGRVRRSARGWRIDGL
jgi:phosphoribosylglycinamide formyltransferase-1